MHLLPCSSALLLDLLISILHLTCQSCSLLLVSLGLRFHFLSLKDTLWVNKFLNYICEVILFSFISDWPEVSPVIALWHHFRISGLIFDMLLERMALREQKEVTPDSVIFKTWFSQPWWWPPSHKPWSGSNCGLKISNDCEGILYLHPVEMYLNCCSPHFRNKSRSSPNSLINSFLLFGT